MLWLTKSFEADLWQTSRCAQARSQPGFVRKAVLAGMNFVVTDVTADERSAAYADAYAANGV